LILLVALVFDRKELSAVARRRRRPPPLRRAGKRRLRRLAPLYDRPDRGERRARGLELVLPVGRDGSPRPQTRQGHLPRNLGLRLPGRLRLLPRVTQTATSPHAPRGPLPSLPRLQGRFVEERPDRPPPLHAGE